MQLLAFAFSMAVFAAPPLGESVFNLNSKWTSPEGKAFTWSSLAGHPSVVAMIYTSCQGSCPLIVEEMKKIESETKAMAQIEGARFVLFSFDPKRDTQKRLKEFAEARQLDPARWKLLSGDLKTVRDLAAVLGVRYRSDERGQYDHSNLITLLDSEGVVRYQQTGLGQNRAPIEEKLSALLGEKGKQ